MKNFLLHYKNNFILTAIISVFFILPDILANYKWNYFSHYCMSILLIEIILTYIFVFLLTMLRPIYFTIISLIFISLGFIEVLYYAFFRTYINDFDWSLLSESEDIIESLKSISTYVIFVIILMFFLLILIFLIAKKINAKQTNTKYTLIITFVLYFLFVISHKEQFPNKKYFSYINISSTMILATIKIFTPLSRKRYIPYTVNKISNGKKIIIVIMGESLNSTLMGLFCPKICDTPLLDKLKKDKNFIYKLAISGGINTSVSIPTFFCLKREPLNNKLLKTEKTNLLKLAEENGYKILWISTQNAENTTKSILLKYAEIIKTRKNWQKPVYDDVLVKYLKTVNFNKKTFLILHLRANHSPYEDYTPTKYQKLKFHYKKYHKYKYNSYLNSVLYVDHIIYSIITYMKNNEKNFSIYFTSDHGEMMGREIDNWKYGHSQLDINCAKVPFLYYSDKTNRKSFDLHIYNHYIIGKMIAKDLGYNIHNPNNNKEYFINSVKLDGKWGFLKYKLNKNKINYKDINVTYIY